ncbi:hypothetical protein CSC12_0045 [Klebsiella michiganensis]|nr:hypothetical protein CSC12_0045 [Klebsiella michiganensis]
MFYYRIFLCLSQNTGRRWHLMLTQANMGEKNVAQNVGM